MLDPRQRRANRSRPRAQQQLVVTFDVQPLGQQLFDRHRLGVGIDGDDLMTGAHIDIEAFLETLRSL